MNWRPSREWKRKRGFLEDDQVREIRRRWDAGERGFEDEYGVSEQVIYRIGIRRRYAGVQDLEE